MFLHRFRDGGVAVGCRALSEIVAADFAERRAGAQDFHTVDEPGNPHGSVGILVVSVNRRVAQEFPEGLVGIASLLDVPFSPRVECVGNIQSQQAVRFAQLLRQRSGNCRVVDDFVRHCGSAVADELQIGSGKPVPRIPAQYEDRRDGRRTVSRHETQRPQLFPPVAPVLRQCFRGHRAGQVVVLERPHVHVGLNSGAGDALHVEGNVPPAALFGEAAFLFCRGLGSPGSGANPAAAVHLYRRVVRGLNLDYGDVAVAQPLFGDLHDWEWQDFPVRSQTRRLPAGICRDPVWKR